MEDTGVNQVSTGSVKSRTDSQFLWIMLALIAVHCCAHAEDGAAVILPWAVSTLAEPLWSSIRGSRAGQIVSRDLPRVLHRTVLAASGLLSASVLTAHVKGNFPAIRASLVL